MTTLRAVLTVLTLALATACAEESPCECDACETALDACEADDQACEDDAVALCDAAAGDDDDDAAR